MENLETLPGNDSLRLGHDSRWWKHVRFIHAVYCLKSIDLCAEPWEYAPATGCQSDRIFGTHSLVFTLAPSTRVCGIWQRSSLFQVCSYLADGRDMSLRSPSPDLSSYLCNFMSTCALWSLRNFAANTALLQSHRNSICGVGLIIFLIKAWADRALVKVLCKKYLKCWNLKHH